VSGAKKIMVRFPRFWF